MKYSRTAIGLLTAQYRSVLKKCLLINLGLFALGAVSATPAMAEYPSGADDWKNPSLYITGSTWGTGLADTTAWMHSLPTFKAGPGPDTGGNAPVTIYGVESVFTILEPTLTATDDVIAKAIYFSVKKSDWYDGTTDDKKPEAVASGDDSVAVGLHAWATAESAAAFGDAANAGGLRSIAIGNSAGASQTGSIAIGARAKSTGTQGIALGNDAKARNTNTIALGQSAMTNGDNSIALGDGAQTGVITGSGTTASPYVFGTKAQFAIALGHEAKATGESGIAMGTNANAAVVGVAIGDHANAVDGGIALGQQSKVLTAHGVALGTNANVAAAAVNSVAIGQNSKATEANTFSVGKADDTRRIVNVTAGTDDTDAVNVAQLNAKLTGTKATSMSDTGDTSFVTAKQVADMNYLTSINSSQVTTALGFTPFNPANIIAADGEASTTNVYSASAIDTKLTGYATTATATASANGLMSAANFEKLAGIEENAQVNRLEGITVGSGASPADAIITGKKINIQSGTTDGTISIGGQEVAVAGLGSAAYTNSTAYATSAQGDLAESAVQSIKIGSGAAISPVSGVLTLPTDDAPVEDSGKLMTSGAIYSTLGNYLTTSAASSTYQTKLTQDANGGANITIDANGKISATDTTYTAGPAIAISSGNEISLNYLADGGLELVPASESLTDAGKLRVKKAASIDVSDGGFVTAAQVAGQNYLQNGSKAKLTLDKTGDTASLVVTDDSNPAKTLAGITLDGGNKLMQLTTSSDGTNKLAKIELNSSGANPVVTVTGELTANDGIKVGNFGIANGGAATLGDTNVNKLHFGSSDTTPTIDGIVTTIGPSSGTGAATNSKLATELAVANALNGKQKNLAAGDGISITTGETTDTIAVKYDNSTIVKDSSTDKLKVGTIAQSQVDGLDTALKAKTTIAASGTDIYTIADGKTDDTHVTKDFYDVTGTNNAIAASAATKANLAGGNKFTGVQEFGVLDGTTFTKKASIDGETGAAKFASVQIGDDYTILENANDWLVIRGADGKARLSYDDAAGLILNKYNTTVNANQQYFSVSDANGLVLSKNGKGYFKSTSTKLEVLDSSAKPTFQVINSTGNVEAKGNVQAAGLTFNGSDIATSITKATSGETAGALSLATAGYAQEQAKTAANNVVKVNTQDSKVIDLNNAEGTNVAQTYTKTALEDMIGDKYNYSAIVGTTNADDPDQNEEISANTHVYSQDKSDELLRLKMNTADWTLENDATKLDGAKLGAGTVGFAAINPAAISTSASVAAILADSHSVDEAVEAASDTKLVTEKAVFAGVGAMFNDKQNWMSEVLGYDTAESIANQLSPLGFVADESGNLGFLQAVSQNKTAIGNIVSANTKLAGIQMSDNSDDPSATKTVHKIDNSVIYDDDQHATGDEDVLATKATVLAALDNPEQDITANKVTANEVDTKALNVAATKAGDENPTKILTAGLDDSGKVLVTVNGKLSTGSLSTVSANITNLRMFNEDQSQKVLAQGIKTTVSADDNANYLITSGGVDAEFTKKVGTLTKASDTTEGKYDTVSVADMIGVDANGELKFTDAAGNFSAYNAAGEVVSTPTSIVEAMNNMSTTMGKIHKLVTRNADGTYNVNATDSSKQMTGVKWTNLAVGTSDEEHLLTLNTVVGNRNYADTTTYATAPNYLTANESVATSLYSLDKNLKSVDKSAVHKAGPETITGVKTFQNGLKVGADYKIDENGDSQLTIRDASNTKPVLLLDKAGKFNLYQFDSAVNKNNPYLEASNGSLTLRADGKQYFEVQNGSLTLRESNGTKANKYLEANSTSFNIYQADGATSAFTVENATGNVTAKGNVQAAGLAFAGAPTVIATAIDAGSAANFDREATSKDAGTLATLKSVDKLAEKATFTPVAPTTGTALNSTVIGDAINELNEKKFDRTDIVTAWSTTTSNTKVASEKLVRDTLDNILDGDTPFTGFTMTNNAASPADVKMLAIDDGTFAEANQSSVQTFATNATVKSAVDSIFGGNPNTWTGVNIFKEQIQAQKGIQIGADYKLEENGAKNLVIRDVATDKAKVVYEEGSLGLYATDNNGSNSSYFSVLSGSTDPKKVDGMRLSSDGKAYFKALVNQLAVIDPATNKLTFSVENATGNVTAKGNAVIAGNLTAGDAAKAQLTVDNATSTISMVTTDSTKTAGMVADGDSVAIEATNGTNDFYIGANAETNKEGVAMGVTKAGEDNLLSGFSATATSAEMGLNNADETLMSGVKVEAGKVSILADKDATTANPVIVAEYDSTTSKNKVTVNGDLTATGNFSAADGGFTVQKDATSGLTDVVATGDIKGKTLSAADTITVGDFNNTTPADAKGVQLDKNGTMTAKDGTNTASYGAAGINVNDNFKVNAAGGVTATSLTLPNANYGQQPGATKTATVTSIDKGANTTLFQKDALATTEAIKTKAQNATFSGNGQKSLKNPYGTGTTATTIGEAINNLATNVDDAFGSIGQYSQLNAQSQIAGSNIHKGDPVSPDTKSPTLVSAAIDLDNAIGDRRDLVKAERHYTNPDSATSLSVSQAIVNMDTKVFQDIHGTGSVLDPTVPTSGPAGTVNIGDLATTTKIGAQDNSGNVLTGMTVDRSSSSTITFTVDTSGTAKTLMTIDSDSVDINGDENVTGNITVASAATGAPKVEIKNDGSVKTSNADGSKTVELKDGAATASDAVTAGAVTAAGALSGNGVQMKNDGTVTAKNGAETAHYDAAGITLNSGATDGSAADNTFTVDTTNGDMMAAAGNFAVTTADGKTTMTIGAPAATATTGKVTIDTTGKIESIGSAAGKKVTIDDGNVVVSGNTKTATFEMPDADQTGATSVKYAQVTGIDVGGDTTTTTFSNQALATTQSIKTKAENADYTASDALKAGNYATAQTSVATLNNAIEGLDLRIGDWDKLQKDNGNLTNGHAGDAGYNEPTTVVEAFNNIDSTLGRIHGLVTKNSDGTYTYNKSSGAVTQDWTNLAVGTTVEEHVLAVDTAIGNRNGYTAAYNINRGESVAESLNNIDLRLGDVKSLNNMHYYGEQNPADVNVTGAVRALDNNLYRVEHDLKTLRHDTYAGLASAAALSALVPNPRGTGDTTLSFGTGAYQGHTAAALGGFHWITNNLLVNAGVGWDNREATTRIGVSYSF